MVPVDPLLSHAWAIRSGGRSAATFIRSTCQLLFQVGISDDISTFGLFVTYLNFTTASPRAASQAGSDEKKCHENRDLSHAYSRMATHLVRVPS